MASNRHVILASHIFVHVAASDVGQHRPRCEPDQAAYGKRSDKDVEEFVPRHGRRLSTR